MSNPFSRERHPMDGTATALVCVLELLIAVHPATAFDPAGRWQLTATDDPVGPLGAPITLTWSIVPDGTRIPNVFAGINRSSNLITWLDQMFGDSGGNDFTSRSWFPVLQASFDRWKALSGVNFVYEPADDGNQHGSSPGILGIRGDIRLSGTLIDGIIGDNVGTLAYSMFPEDADLVFDTGDQDYFGDPSGDYSKFRHTMMHEIGHSLGLGHVTSPDAAILLEPFPQSNFDGPQLDDIRGVQYLYGDAFESSNGGTGNNKFEHATELGAIAAGQSVAIGAHAALQSMVLSAETDFVSIARQSDFDFYSFSISESSDIYIVLTPVGTTYRQLVQITGQSSTIDSSAVSELDLQLWDATDIPALVGSTSQSAAGMAESLLGFAATKPGEYVVRVAGSNDDVQMYQLQIAVEALQRLAADYNGDGTVNAADYTVWRDSVGSKSQLAADGDGSGAIDAADYMVWLSYFGHRSASTDDLNHSTIPEPASLALLLMMVLSTSTSAGAFVVRPRRRCSYAQRENYS